MTMRAASPSRARYRIRRRVTPYLYIAPALLVFGVFVLAPFLHSAWLSLFRWDGISPATWVGLGNYRDLLHDDVARSAFRHSVELMAFFVFLPLVGGLVLASALVTTRVRGSGALRAIIFLPQVLSLVVIGVTWNWMLADDGPFNQILRGVGLGSLARPWLGDFTWALPSIGVIGAWALTGLYMTLFIAAMQQIPPSFYEACRIDGGGRVREFFTVTMPGLRGQIAIVVTLSVVAALRAFDVIFVTTHAGPGTSSIVPGYLLYQRAFVSGAVGSACAIGVVLALVIFCIVVVSNRFVAR